MKLERPKVFSKKFGLLCLLFYIYKINYVQCQCQRRDDLPCVWQNDPNTKIKWKSQTEAQGSPYVEATKCSAKQCGEAIILSSWMEPTNAANKVLLDYQIYGYTVVSLTLLLKPQDSTQPEIQLLQIKADYGQPRPVEWSTQTAVIPKQSSKYRFILKANVAYDGAYIAVKEIVLGGSGIETENDNQIGNDKSQPYEEPRLSRGGYGKDDSSITKSSGARLIVFTVLCIAHQSFNTIQY